MSTKIQLSKEAKVLLLLAILYSLTFSPLPIWLSSFIYISKESISRNIESIAANMPFGRSSNCERLANKVLSASAEKAAEEGGQLISYGELKLISKTNKSIVCRGYFEGNGVWRSDNYIISEGNNGVYWRTPGRIEYQFQQEMDIPEQQIEFQIEELQ